MRTLIPQNDTMKHIQLTIFTGLSILFAVANPLHARADEVGVSSDTILFGQVAALEGRSSALGQGMRQGILAAFVEINARGGAWTQARAD
jgi:ABC-type branched-subunit amino acid transport system substrate-binding protein